MEPEITALLDSLAALAENPMADGFAEYYAVPVTLVRPRGTTVVEDRESLLHEIRAAHYPLPGHRAGGVRYAVVEQQRKGPFILSIDVRWERSGALGRPLRNDFTTYVLLRSDDGIRVVAQIDHTAGEPAPATAG